MTADRMQAQRFERKYFITPRQADEVRAFVAGYLELDEFSRSRPDHSYPVHSVYLDSDQLTTYWATVHCEKKRFKIRVRYYSDDSPLFFEIKRRENECVLKQRGAVHREFGALLLAGQLPAPEHLISNKPQHLAALQRFCYLMQRMRAKPTVHVGYLREAWVSREGNSVRVTIDQDVRGEIRREARFTTQMDHPVWPFKHQLILEIKFTDRFPDWLRDMVRHLNLLQCGVPKYCGSVMVEGEQRIVAKPAGGEEEKLAAVMKYC